MLDLLIGLLIGLAIGYLYYLYKRKMYLLDKKELDLLDVSNMQVYDFHGGAVKLTNYLFLVCGIMLAMAILVKDAFTVTLAVSIICIGISERIFSKYYMVFYHDEEKCVLANKLVKYKDIDRCGYVKKLVIEQGCVYLKDGSGYYTHKPTISYINYHLRKMGRKVEEED